MNADDLDDGLEYAYISADEHGDAVAIEAADASETEDAPTETLSKKEKQKEKQKEKRKNKKRELENGDEEKNSIKKQKMQQDVENKVKLASESGDRIASSIAARIRAQNPDLSALELEDLYISKNQIVASDDWEEKRTLDNLAKFLRSKFGDFLDSKAKRQFLVIVSMSAIRVCDVRRATRDMKCGSLKLMSKNKFKDDLATVKKTKCRILAVTPSRLHKLLQEGGLLVEEIRNLVVDTSYLDSKKRNVWDEEEFWKVLHLFSGKETAIALY